MEAVLFAITAVLGVAGGIGVIAAREPVHSALGLLLALLSLAVDYLLLDAQFIAVLQVIVYAGAIVVLFVFIIMLLRATGEAPRDRSIVSPGVAGVLGTVLAAALLVAAVTARSPMVPVDPAYGTVQHVGRALFRAYALPFEAASIALVVGMIGAVALGKRAQIVVAAPSRTGTAASAQQPAARSVAAGTAGEPRS
ncbi:MAG TPA: NADH-quinone oxidoreductase subunit J [bacterium]|nr:NADH-quinone oxidoreductase subunit J [bacterium]